MSEALRSWRRWCLVFSLAQLGGSCGSQSSGTDTRTNWLMACDDAAECGGDLACLCGMCTVSCEDSAGCAGLGEDAACFAVEGCRGVASVCSTPEVEAARASDNSEARGDTSGESFAASGGDAGVHGESTERASVDDGTGAATFTSNETNSTGSIDETSAEPGDSRSTASDSEFTGGEPTSTGASGADTAISGDTATSAETSCSPSAAEAGLCGEVVACESGASLPTTQPCEVTGLVMRSCLGGQWVDNCVSCQRIALADPALERVIRNALYKPTGELTQMDSAQLTGLNAEGQGISDLRGIECFMGLSFLELSMNSISDVSPLGRLSTITHLGLTQNRISDIAPLANLGMLEELWIGGNTIADISPLALLTNLSLLFLSDNAISDLTPLQELTALTDLNVSLNDVTSIEPLSGLVELKSLTVGPNPAFDGDLSVVPGFPQLEFLALANCGLSDAELEPLSGLTYLDFLELTTNHIVDVAALGAYSSTTLALNENPLDCDSASLAALEAQNVATYTDCF